MTNQRVVTFAWWCAATIFLSAFLLFQVQPVISKMILPWFGGGPAVWTACMLFFQVLLLGGYAYAHFLQQVPHAKGQMIVHVVLIVLAAATLPITPHPAWKPVDGTQPTWRILLLLLANVGLPYFVLSATGPLVQVWFARVLPGRSPYRLYALSNVGSLGALLSYPFLFEPMMTTGTQGGLWSILFGLFALLCGSLAVVTYRTAATLDAAAGEAAAEQQQEPEETEAEAAPTPPETAAGAGPAETAAPVEPGQRKTGRAEAAPPAGLPSVDQRLAWLLLPALASVMLLAITNHVCQDVAVVPFFWVVPLSLYLLSFIICFDREIWYRRRIFSIALTLAVLAVCLTQLDTPIEKLLKKINFEIDISDYMGELLIEAAVYLGLLFVICMVCHGELVRLKPPTRWLTSFYLMVAAGGALGGIIVALICPQVFSTHLEMQIGLVAAFMLALGVLWDDLWLIWPLKQVWGKCLAFGIGFLLLLVAVRAQFESLNSEALTSIRNFYGVLSIEEYHRDTPNHIRRLLNGRILHGAQFLGERSHEPTTYYNEESGIGLTLNTFISDGPLRVAVVGLGTGTIATYGQPGDYYCFYEINPNVRHLATTQFTFLEDSAAEVNVILGDARIQMENQKQPQNYDVIALDAFSGDAIPAHLLTVEAFQEYFRHLQPQGVIAVHISNRHLDLAPVVGGIAEHLEVPAVLIDYVEDGLVGQASSDWVLITHNTAFLEHPDVEAVALPLDYEPVRLWTDQYSNLFQILR